MIMDNLGEIIMVTGFLLVIFAVFLPLEKTGATEEDAYDI